MILLVNIIRAVLFWWWQWLIFMLLYLLFSLTIVLLPIWKSFRELSKLIIMPFWKRIVRDTEKWKYEKWFWLIFNIIWFPIWLFLTIWYFISWILSFITIIWIPYWIVSIRLSKFIFLPIWVRVLTEDEYISHKVGQEIGKYKNWLEQQNIQTNFIKEDKIYNNKIELSEEDKVYLREQQIELELLKQKQELEAIKRQQEFDEKIEKIKNSSKDFFWKILLDIKNIFQKYKPIVIEKSWIVANNISEKIKETDFEGIKNKWLDTIKKSNKINKKYIYWVLIIIWISVLTFIWFKLYEKYLYYNQIIKTDEKIFLRKEPDFIEFFNNNKIKIIPENKEHILSQMLFSYRKYNDNYDSWYKYAWYSVLKLDKEIPKELPKDVHYSTFNDKDSNIITKNIWNNTLLEIQSEKEKNINIYETELFKSLNNFTNKNTFYSSIDIWNKSSGNFSNNILNIFWLRNIIFHLDELLWYNRIWINNKLLWLDYKNNDLILRLEFNYNDVVNTNETSIKDGLNQLENIILESDPIIFKTYKITENEKKIKIDIIFKLDYDKIKNNDSINNLPILNNNY